MKDFITKKQRCNFVVVSSLVLFESCFGSVLQCVLGRRGCLLIFKSFLRNGRTFHYEMFCSSLAFDLYLQV